MNRVIFTVYDISDGTGKISASFRGNLRYEEGEEVCIFGKVKYGLPWWGQHAGPTEWIEIKDIFYW